MGKQIHRLMKQKILDHCKARLKIPLEAPCTEIVHGEAIVATVYCVGLPKGQQAILKICDQENHYWREVYFLKKFAGKIPVPQVLESTPPEEDFPGAILMVSSVPLTKRRA